MCCRTCFRRRHAETKTPQEPGLFEAIRNSPQTKIRGESPKDQGDRQTYTYSALISGHVRTGSNRRTSSGRASFAVRAAQPPQ